MSNIVRISMFISDFEKNSDDYITWKKKENIVVRVVEIHEKKLKLCSPEKLFDLSKSGTYD